VSSPSRTSGQTAPHHERDESNEERHLATDEHGLTQIHHREKHDGVKSTKTRRNLQHRVTQPGNQLFPRTPSGSSPPFISNKNTQVPLTGPWVYLEQAPGRRTAQSARRGSPHIPHTPLATAHKGRSPCVFHLKAEKYFLCDQGTKCSPDPSGSSPPFISNKNTQVPLTGPWVYLERAPGRQTKLRFAGEIPPA
jgi:hypothetical protein